MIAIIIAVIAGLIILYFLWSKGMLPFLFGADEASCRTALIKACAYSNINDKQTQLGKINPSCSNNYKDTPSLQSSMKNCISNPQSNSDDCDSVCAQFG
jgi:hypothetical protein